MASTAVHEIGAIFISLKKGACTYILLKQTGEGGRHYSSLLKQTGEGGRHYSSLAAQANW
jgi:hypothetical protein